MKNFINFSADQFSVDSCQWVISHRWWVIASVLLFTAVLSTQIRSLDFATDYRVFFSGENLYKKRQHTDCCACERSA
jgi:predicted RND superfamily exporter protein